MRSSTIGQRILKNFSISFAGSMGLMIISLVRTAVLTKTLSIDDYGRVLIVLNLIGFLINFLSLRVEDLMFRFYAAFNEQKDLGGLRGLFVLGILLSVSMGVIVTFGLFFLSPWISRNIYNDPELTFAIRVYSFTALLFATEGFSTSILRLKDRFASVVFPRVTGALIAVIGYVIYFSFAQEYTISNLVLITSLEVAFQTLIPLVLAMRIIAPYLFLKEYPILHSLRQHGRMIFAAAFNTNLYGYLYKLTGPPGDLFLIGVFASPYHVAIYNIAQQIIRAVIVLQTNIQTAVTPEIVSLWAKKQFHKLYQALLRFSGYSFSLGIIAVVFGFVLARPLVLIISSNEYLDAAYILYILILKVYITFSTLPFYSLTLSMDMLIRRNIALFAQLILTGLVIIVSLTAFNMALLQLVGVLLVFLICDLPVGLKLREMSRSQTLVEV
jgi:O-antigen/teichoic acid export membrane protein